MPTWYVLPSAPGQAAEVGVDGTVVVVPVVETEVAVVGIEELALIDEPEVLELPVLVRLERVYALGELLVLEEAETAEPVDEVDHVFLVAVGVAPVDVLEALESDESEELEMAEVAVMLLEFDVLVLMSDGPFVPPTSSRNTLVPATLLIIPTYALR